jgi:hypothetical protein
MDKNINSEVRERMEECSRKGWIKAWFAIEVMARDKETTEESLKSHIAQMETAKDMFIFDKKFSEIQRVENPMRDIKEAYSQVVEITVYVKDFYSFINIVVAFGPSAIEILEPKEYKLRIDEMQSLSNVISGLMHQFASAGIGGMVITPPKKKQPPVELGH